MKPLAERDPFRIGIVAIVVGGLIGLAIVVLSVVSFGTSSYTAVLEHTAGLRKGEDVQVHGVSVGEVTGVRLMDTSVEVTFVLDQDIELGSETTAAVKVATLLGTHYLEVDPEGSRDAGGRPDPARADRRALQPPGRDRGRHEAARGARRGQLAKALTATSDTLTRSGDDIGPALEGVTRLSEVLTKRSGQTGELLRAARAVTDQLSDSSERHRRADGADQPGRQRGHGATPSHPPAAASRPRRWRGP